MVSRHQTMEGFSVVCWSVHYNGTGFHFPIIKPGMQDIAEKC
jgi:hypothetical protein